MEQEPRLPVLDDDGLVAHVVDRHRAEPVEDPPHRRSSLLPAPRIDGAGDEQTVDGPRHRDVVQAETLGLLGLLLDLAHRLVVERAVALARRRVEHLEAEEAVRPADDLLAAPHRPVAARVRHDDDAELEPLRRMDREQANGVTCLLLRKRLGLVGARRLPIVHEAHEALDVAAAKILERSRQPPQLPQIRIAAPAVRSSEDGEVVVVLRHDLVDQPLEPDRCRQCDEAVVALAERLEELLVPRRQALGQIPLDAQEQRTTAGRATQQD